MRSKPYLLCVPLRLIGRWRGFGQNVLSIDRIILGILILSALLATLNPDGGHPLAVTSGDFNEDGIQDLVVSREAAIFGEGALTMLTGTDAAIYPRHPANLGAMETFSAPMAIGARFPVSPRMMAAGDFDADGHQDIAVTEESATAIYLLSGNGRGGFAEPRAIPVSGVIVCLQSGEVNRPDGLKDLAVSIVTEDGLSRLLIFERPEGALRAEPEVIPLPAPAHSLAFGRFDGDAMRDVAAATSGAILIVQGRDRRLSLDPEMQAQVPPAGIVSIPMDRVLVEMTSGNFLPGAEDELALLDDAGDIQFLRATHGEGASGEVAAAAVPDAWTMAADGRRLSLPSRFGSRGRGRMLAAQVAASPVEQVVVLDSTERRLYFLRSEEARPAFKSMTEVEGVMSRELPGEPVAFLPMRLNTDSLSDLVVVNDGATRPSFLMTEAQNTFTVTNTNFSGPGSFLQALRDANANPGPDRIEFNLPGAGPHKIDYSLSEPINDSVVIDGTTQPGYNGAPIVEVPGRLLVQAGNTVIRGLILTKVYGLSPNQEAAGIWLKTGGNNIVENCYFGLSPAGDCPQMQGRCDFRSDVGIRVSTDNNLIGGTNAKARNVIGSSSIVGLMVDKGTGNRIVGNYIGTEASGNRSVFNPHNTWIAGQETVLGGTEAGAGNLIGGAYQVDLNIFPCAGCRVQGNSIGYNPQTATLLSVNNGIGFQSTTGVLLGGTTPSARNVIASDGINLFVTVEATGNLIQGNYLGVEPTGMRVAGYGLVTIGGKENTLGGTTPGARNIIGAAVETGIGSSGNRLQGNYIGTNAAGTAALLPPLGASNPEGTPVALYGKDNLLGGLVPEARNVISGHSNPSVAIDGEGIRVQGNYIGTQADGVSPLGNKGPGISASYRPNTGAPLNPNLIGGIEAGAGNVIAFNQGPGIELTKPGIIVRGNAIHHNGGVGIDRGGDGASPNIPNESHSGLDAAQNYPVIELATTIQGNLTIAGKLNSYADSDFLIDFYLNDACDDSGNGEGRQYLGTTQVRTDSSFNAGFLVTLPVAGAQGKIVTATATRAGVVTSEFSSCRVVSTDCATISESFAGAIGADGGQATLTVAGLAGCQWTASSDAPWLSIVSGSAGMGSGTITVAAGPNPGVAPRVGFIRVKDQQTRIVQAGRVTVVSAASFLPDNIGQNAILAAFGLDLAKSAEGATSVPLPTKLAGTRVLVRNLNLEQEAGLFYVSPEQINFHLPFVFPNTEVSVKVISAEGLISEGKFFCHQTSGSLFTANADGKGVPAGYVIRVRADSSQIQEPIAQYDQTAKRYVPLPIDLGPESEQVFLILFGTGFPPIPIPLTLVSAKAGSEPVEVAYFGRSREYVGVDQINLKLPRSLIGKGQVNLDLIAEGKPVPPVVINIK